MLGSSGVLGRFHAKGGLRGGLAAAGRAKSLQVACSSNPNKNNKPSFLDPDVHERAISILRNTQNLDWRTFTERLGGTLVVTDEEHRSVVQQAAKEKNLSFGFSAGGLLFPFYVGVSGALQDAGLLADETKIGGASAGSLIAACIKSGMTLDEVTEHCMRLMADCRQNGTRGRLGPVLETFLQDHLPDDAHERCKDRAYVAVTKALPYVRPVLVSEFYSRDDLIQALMTSCHIPFYLDGDAYTNFRGAAHLDGGLTNFIPVVPGTVGVRVCCFPSKQLSPLYRIGISPDSYDEEWSYNLRQMVQWAFEPADDKFVQYFIEKGKRDAQSWMEHMGLGKESAVVEEAVQSDEGQVTAAKRAAAGTGDSQAQAEQEEQGAEELRRRGKAQAAAGNA